MSETIAVKDSFTIDLDGYADQKMRVVWDNTRVLNDKNYRFTPVDFYIVMNSLKNDYGDIFNDNTDMYIKMACKWLEDSDAVEYKTYEYFTHIPKRD